MVPHFNCEPRHALSRIHRDLESLIPRRGQCLVLALGFVLLVSPLKLGVRVGGASADHGSEVPGCQQ